MLALLRRTIVLLAVVGLMGIASCTSGGAPSPTAAPAKATAPEAATAVATAKPSANVTPAAKSGSPEPKPAAGSDWKADWEKTLSAARSEGKVVVAAGPGDLYRTALTAFEKAYPGIKVELTGVRGPDFAPRLIAERDGGQFLWDVYLSGWNSPLPLKEKGILAPLRPLLVQPEILDEGKWFGGFENSWVDRERQYVFSFSAYINYLAYANTEVVPEAEIKTSDILIDPKMKGKIASADLRVSGGPNVRTGVLLMLKGEDWVRKFLSQDISIVAESRQLGEGLVRGRYPIGFGLNMADLETFTQQGLTKSLKPIAPDTREGTRVNSGFGNLSLISKAPHPNAAKVFVNWLLSPEGQKTYVEATGVNSRRLDVPQLAGKAPDPKVKYDIDEREEAPLLPAMDRAQELAKEMIK